MLWSEKKKKNETENFYNTMEYVSFYLYILWKIVEISKNTAVKYQTNITSRSLQQFGSLSVFTSCHARRESFLPKMAIFPQFSVYLSITQAKQINNKYPIISIYTDEFEKRAKILVTRYGPQSVAQRKCLNGGSSSLYQATKSRLNLKH